MRKKLSRLILSMKRRKMKQPKETKKFVLDRHIVQRFAANDEAWRYMFHHFQQHLPILLYSYTLANQRPCVIFDIDFTVLQYSMFMKPPNGLRLTSPYVRLLYNLFRTYKVPIYFVTARPLFPFNEAWTQKELQSLGLVDYQGIFFMPMSQTSVGLYKQGIRNQLKQKYTVLFNAGDQWTDFTNEDIDDNAYNQPMVLYNIEPKSDWSLKLIEPPSLHTAVPYLNSVFETIAF